MVSTITDSVTNSSTNSTEHSTANSAISAELKMLRQELLKMILKNESLRRDQRNSLMIRNSMMLSPSTLKRHDLAKGAGGGEPGSS